MPGQPLSLRRQRARHEHQAAGEGLTDADLQCPGQVRDVLGELQRRNGQAPQSKVTGPAGQCPFPCGQGGHPSPQLAAAAQHVQTFRPEGLGRAVAQLLGQRRDLA
jgi:hypothetical protein